MPHLGMGELVIIILAGGVASLVLSTILGGLGSGRTRPGLDDAATLDLATATPHTLIADVREGEWVRIVGAVQGPVSEPELRAPLAGTYGVAHHSVVERGARLVADDAMPLAEERRAIDFVVGDGTGHARVLVSGARIVLTLHTIEPPTARVDAWLTRRGMRPAPNALCREAVVSREARVTVVGRARWENDPDVEPRDPDASYRKSVRARRLVLESTRDRAIVVSDGERLT